MNKTIEIRKSKCGSVQTFTPLIDGNLVLPCAGVTCYGIRQISTVGVILDIELRKVGHTLDEFIFAV